MTSEYLLRLALAVGAGALVGLERELRGHAAGVRTHALVATGAALFTLAGIEGAGGAVADPMRVAAQVVSGIGFVGAGAILQDSSGVRGLTTATTIWASGALGVVCAVGNAPLALAGIGIVIVILLSRRPLNWILRTARRTTELTVGLEYEIGHGTIGPLIEIASTTESDIVNLTMTDTTTDNENEPDTAPLRTAQITLRTPAAEVEAITDTVTRISHRREVRTLTYEPTPTKK